MVKLKSTRLIDELLSRDGDYAAHFASWWEDAIASNKSDTFGGVLQRSGSTGFQARTRLQGNQFGC